MPAVTGLPEDRRIGQPSVQEFLARQWKAHRSVFRAGGFDLPDRTFGFAAVDRGVQPPEMTLVAVAPSGKVLAMRASLLGDAEALADIPDLAARLLSGGAASDALGIGDALAFMGIAGDRPTLVSRSVQRFAEGIGDARITARLPLANLAASEARRFDDSGLARVRAALNADALAALGAAGPFQWRDYLYYAEPGEAGRLRRQAAGVYPLLATVMAGRPSIKGAIDRKEPLADAIQAAFGADAGGKPRMGKGVLKRIQGVTWPTGGIAPEQIGHALSDIPPDWFPRDRAEWDAFCDVTATVGMILKPSTGQPSETLYAGCGGKWADFQQRAAKAYTDSRSPEGYEADPPGWLRGPALRAVQAAFAWQDAQRLAPPALAAETARFASAFAFPEGVEKPAEYDSNSLADWLSRTATFQRVRSAIDWKALDRLPRAKVEAGAIEAAARIPDLPEHMSRDGIAYWIRRLYAPDASREAMRTACIGVDDMIGTFAKKVILPLAALRSGLQDAYLAQVHREEARAAAAKVLCGGMAAATIFESSRWFHSQFEQILAAGADRQTDAERLKRETEARKSRALNALGINEAEIPQDGWAPLCAISQAPNGVYIVPLTDPRLLEMEGRFGINDDGTEGLYHCVGGYSEKCRRGSHILSLRDLTEGQGFVRLSTADIAPIVYGDKHIDIHQHYGKGNGQAPERAVRAMEWFTSAVAFGTVPLNYDGIKQHLGALSIRSDEVAAACGYDWRDEDRIGRAMAPWGKLVGKRYRKMGLEAFGAEPEIAAITNLFNPVFVPRGL